MSTEEIREWMQNETAFIGRTDELFITTFLEACDNDVEKSKQRIVRYYELRRLYPGLMRNRDVLNEKNAKLIRQKVFYCEESDDLDLPVVLTVKLSRLERDDNLCDVLRFLIIVIECGLIKSARFRNYGGIAIIDFENFEFAHSLQVTPNILMQAYKCLLEGLPFKYQAIHIINAGAMLRAVFSVGTLFLPTEIRNMITMSSGSWESIQDKVPPQCLPIEYGGTNGTLEQNLEQFWTIMMKWREYMLDDEKYGFNNATP